MSIRAIQAVWDRTRAGGSMRLLLLALADFADEDGYSWPSIETLAQRAGRSERQVRRLIGIAIELGELEAHRAGGLTTSRYWLTPGGAPLRGVTPASGGGGHVRPPRGDTHDPRGGTPVSPDPSIEPSREPSESPPARAIAAGANDPVVRYHDLTGRFPSERIREWLNDVALHWGDSRLAEALAEAYSRDATYRGLISRALDVLNEHAHEVERRSRTAAKLPTEPPKPEQSDEEKAAIAERNADKARRARAAMLVDGTIQPTRGDEDRALMAEEIERRKATADV